MNTQVLFIHGGSFTTLNYVHFVRIIEIKDNVLRRIMHIVHYVQNRSLFVFETANKRVTADSLQLVEFIPVNYHRIALKIGLNRFRRKNTHVVGIHQNFVHCSDLYVHLLRVVVPTVHVAVCPKQTVSCEVIRAVGRICKVQRLEAQEILDTL